MFMVTLPIFSIQTMLPAHNFCLKSYGACGQSGNDKKIYKIALIKLTYCS